MIILYSARYSEASVRRRYIDEGLSGVKAKKRENFNEMIENILNDTLDLIVAK